MMNKKNKLMIICIGLLLCLTLSAYAGKGNVVKNDSQNNDSKNKQPVTTISTPDSKTDQTLMDKLNELLKEIPSAQKSRTGEQINWQVISSGGTKGSSTNWQLAATVGQAGTGYGSSSNYQVNSGFWAPFSGSGGGCCLNAGDANHDGSVDISDLTYYVTFMFGGGPAPICLDEFDNDANCGNDISDLTFYVDYMFGGGAAPVCGCVL
jgi:hypothetical protein